MARNRRGGDGLLSDCAQRNSKESEMKLLGLFLAVCGWLIPVIAVTVTSSTSVRLILCLVGITTCVFGILGLLNRSYLKQPIWRK